MPSFFDDAFPGTAGERAPSRSRRGFLKHAALSAAGLAGVLTGCGGEERPTRPDSGVQTPTGEEPPLGLSGPVQDCQNTEALSTQDLQVRQALGYVPDSPEPDEQCANCRFYEPPQGGASDSTASGGNAACGGCQLFPGPVVAGGWCSSWAAQQS